MTLSRVNGALGGFARLHRASSAAPQPTGLRRAGTEHGRGRQHESVTVTRTSSGKLACYAGSPLRSRRTVPQFSGGGVALQRAVLILVTGRKTPAVGSRSRCPAASLSDALDSRDDDSHDGKHVGYRNSVAMGENHKSMSLERPIGKGPDNGE